MYIKTYENFLDFFKKKTQRMTPIEFLNWCIANYKEFENNKKYYFFNVSIDSTPSISYSSLQTGDYHVMLRKENDKYVIIDFNGPDGKMGDMDPKTHKYKTWDSEITKEQFDHYSKEFEIIDEYLNQKDEEKHKKETPAISSEGELLNVKEDPLEQASFLVTEHLSKYIGKSFVFDTDYVIWTSDSTNNSSEKEIEETEFKIVEFSIGVYGNWDENDTKPKFYGKIITDWSIDKKEYSIMIAPDYKPEWVDLNKREFDKILKPHTTEKKTRREESKFWKNKNKYPIPHLTSITPAKYDTIEMIKDFIEIITQINDQVE